MDDELGLEGPAATSSRLPRVDPELSDSEDITATANFSVNRMVRTKLIKNGSETIRSKESLEKFISDEGATTRRMGGPAGVSVVVKGGSEGRPHVQRNTSSGGRTTQRSSGGGVLLSKGTRFG